MGSLPIIPRAVAEKLGHYVYLYVDPADNRVIYVGKGKGTRAVSHLKADEKKGISRELKRIRADGRESRIDILAHSLPDEETALKIETAAIDLIGVEDLV